MRADGDWRCYVAPSAQVWRIGVRLRKEDMQIGIRGWEIMGLGDYMLKKRVQRVRDYNYLKIAIDGMT